MLSYHDVLHPLQIHISYILSYHYLILSKKSQKASGGPSFVLSSPSIGIPHLWLNSIGVVRTPWPHQRPSESLGSRWKLQRCATSGSGRAFGIGRVSERRFSLLALFPKNAVGDNTWAYRFFCWWKVWKRGWNRFFSVDMFFSNSKLYGLIMYDMAWTAWPFSTNPDTIFGVPQDSLSIKNHPIGMHHICTQLPHDVF